MRCHHSEWFGSKRHPTAAGSPSAIASVTTALLDRIFFDSPPARGQRLKEQLSRHPNAFLYARSAVLASAGLNVRSFVMRVSAIRAPRWL